MNPVRSRRPGAVHISAPSFPVGVRPSVYRRIAYTFIGLTVIVILGVLWLTSVRAEVVVKLKRDAVRLDGVVEVAKEPRDGQIPGRVVQDTYTKTREFQVAKDAPAPAPTPTPTPVPAPEPEESNDVTARGTVKIINSYSKAQTLVKTTRLLTPDGKLYRIDATVNVPAKSELTVPAYSDKPGREYVLTSPTKFTIPGLFVDLQQFIFAETVGAFTAVPRGSTPSAAPAASTPRPVATSPNARPVSYEDLENAKKSLTDEILDEAMKALADQVENKESMEVVYVVKVADESKNANVGQVTDSFLYSIKLDVTAVYYSKEDMQALVRSRLRERVPAGREFLPFTGGAVTYALESANPQTEVAAMRVTADADYRLSPTSPLLQKSVIAGKSIEEAKGLLMSIEGVESVEVTVRPSWLGSLPALKDRIKLDIQ
ncbi:hypothetical protein IT087_00035 [Candidatus Uhrbacteria bacterium]|nr:hypothetical protein [Candidatus Uhrbacteria bacterium]